MFVILASLLYQMQSRELFWMIQTIVLLAFYCCFLYVSVLVVTFAKFR
jgi:hypothetical protein